MLDSSPVAIILADENGIIEAFNEPATAAFGFTQKEAVGQPVELLIPKRHREDHPKLRDSYHANPSNRAMGIGRTVYGLRKDGTEFPADVGLRTMTQNGHRKVIAAVNDLTDTYAARRAANESEARFFNIANSCPLSIWVCDSDSDCTWLNNTWFEYSGTTLDENLGSGWLEIVHPDDRESAGAIYLDAFKQQKEFTLEYRLRRHDGEYRWHTAIGKPRFGEDKSFLGFTGTSIDDHDQREIRLDLEQANSNLQETKTVYRSLIDQNTNYLKLLSLDGKLVDANATALTAAGIKLEDVKGKHLADTHWWSHAPELQSRLRESIETAAQGDSIAFEASHLVSDETVVDIAFSVKPVRDSQGKEIYLLAEGKDVTEHKLKEKTLKQLNASLHESEQKAMEASRAKSEFLANMSHEIRTPLNAIIGLSNIVLQSELNDLQRDYLSTVSESSESLLQVINDILDFSKIEAGKLELEQTDFQIRELAGDALKSLALKAHAKDLELTYRCDAEVPEVLVGDPGRLRQIFVNLVGNAIKFTKTGYVLVDIRRSNESVSNPDGVMLDVSVTDTGIGIDPNEAERIFEEFEQADTSTTRRYGGTGLGLSITSRLVEAMNGEISVSSEVGKGSTFRFKAEFAHSDKQPLQPWREAVQKLGKLRALIVDDNAVNLTILEESLAPYTDSLEKASNGDDAISLLVERAREGRPFNMVISDVNMPRMDGYSLAEKIRKEDSEFGMPIILLTSSGYRGPQRQMSELNIAGRLLKPVKQSELLELMVHALGLVDKVQTGPVAMSDKVKTDAKALTSLSILLAEDSVPNQKLAMAMLNSAGHHAVVAETGREAVDASGAQDFDVVLMDLQMPEMDGLQATAAIRQRDRIAGRHTPIVAMTAHALSGDREKCLSAGMDDYVTKPVRPDKLFAAIGRAISGEMRAVEHANSPSSAVTPVDIPWEELLRTLGGDRKTLADIVDAYVDEIAEVVPRIVQAIDSNDAAQLRKSAHKLKSAMRYFQLSEAGDTAQQLENYGQCGDFTKATEDWAKLRGVVTSLEPTLTNAMLAIKQ